MLDEFVVANRDSVISRVQLRVASRQYPSPTDEELTNGIPMFLDQLVDALRRAKSSDTVDHQQLTEAAARHGHDLLRMGFTIGQVVHDYGDVCQVITELAVQQRAPISSEEFRTLNLCLDDAIAGAVTEYARQREASIQAQGIERLGVLAHEMRNLLNVATIAFEHLKSGRVAVLGSTGALLGRSMVGLRDLIDRTLADVRLDAGIEHLERLSVAEFIEEIEIGASMQAQAHGIHFQASRVDRTVSIEGDRQILVAAVSNLLQNAFKFSRKAAIVALTTEVQTDRVLFHVEDECGGLPPGKTEQLFRPYVQRGTDRGGVGLGLSICLKAAKASGGEIHVRDLPGKGCIFTLELPRKPPPPLTYIDGGKGKDGMPRKPGVAGTLRPATSTASTMLVTHEATDTNSAIEG